MFDASFSALLDTAVAEAASGTGQAQATGALVEALGLTDPPTALALRYAVAIVRGERRRSRAVVVQSDLLTWVRSVSDAGLDVLGAIADQEDWAVGAAHAVAA